MEREKKVLVFVVEGPTEETALAEVLERVFLDDHVPFDVAHGDLTLAKGDKKDARERVRDEVLSQIGSNKGCGWNDLKRIIQMKRTLHNRGYKPSDGEKIKLANDSRRRHSDDPEGYKEVLRNENLLSLGSFDETWAFLEHDFHSLERWSNLYWALGKEVCSYALS